MNPQPIHDGQPEGHGEYPPPLPPTADLRKPIGHLIDTLRTRLAHLLRVSDEHKPEIYLRLAHSAELSELNYWLQVVFACGIATLGLVLNSPAVVIGAMLISPLMGPILANGLALIIGDVYLGLKSFANILISSLMAIGISALLVALLPFKTITAEIAARIQPTALDLTVALLCGLAGAVGACLSQTQAGTAAPGVAIAVALMPPLCVVGFGVGVGFDWKIVTGGGLLFLANLVAIIVISMLVFFVVRMDTVGVKEQADQWEESREEMVKRFSHVIRRLPFYHKVERAGTPLARIAIILLFLLIIFIPLKSALNRVTREVKIRQEMNKRIGLFAQPGRSTIDAKEVITGQDKVIVLLRVSTSEFFNQDDRDRFEREASTALGLPVELELTQNVASLGDGDAITRLLALRTPELEPPLKTVPELAAELSQRVQRLMLGIPLPPDVTVLEARTIVSNQVNRLRLEIIYLSQQDLTPDAQAVISQIVQRGMAVAELEIAYQRIATAPSEIRFDYGSDSLSEAMATTCDGIGQLLSRYPSLSGRLTAFAEPRELRGDQELANKRAQAVQSRLQTRWQIDPKRIQVEMGTESLRAVTISVVPTSSPPS